MGDRNRGLLLGMIPLHLLLLLWVWCGRMLWGVGGWMMLVILMAMPFVALALVVSTMLCFLGPDRPRRLTDRVAALHLWLWGLLFVCGLMMPDVGDTPESVGSLLTRLLGPSDLLISLSGYAAAVAGLGAVLVWLGIVVVRVRELRATSYAD